MVFSIFLLLFRNNNVLKRQQTFCYPPCSNLTLVLVVTVSMLLKVDICFSSFIFRKAVIVSTIPLFQIITDEDANAFINSAPELPIQKDVMLSDGAIPDSEVLAVTLIVKINVSRNIAEVSRSLYR